jgi:hypothetical protein
LAINSTDILLKTILPILPNATVGEDKDGQIVIYTGLRERVTLVPFGEDVASIPKVDLIGDQYRRIFPDALANVTEDFSTVFVVLNRHDLTQDQIENLFRAIGYAFRQHFRGERLGVPVKVYGNVYAASYDITKSQSDDWLRHRDDAIEAAHTYAEHGSPIRKYYPYGQLVSGLGSDPIVVIRFA